VVGNKSPIVLGQIIAEQCNQHVIVELDGTQSHVTVLGLSNAVLFKGRFGLEQSLFV
jgi:hypothetical protein